MVALRRRRIDGLTVSIPIVIEDAMIARRHEGTKAKKVHDLGDWRPSQAVSLGVTGSVSTPPVDGVRFCLFPLSATGFLRAICKRGRLRTPVPFVAEIAVQQIWFRPSD